VPRETNDEPEVVDFNFEQVLAAVADPIRLSIIAQLAAAEQDLSCGAIELPIKTSTATHHFTALRRAGVLHQYYAGTSRMNVLRRQDMERAFPGFLTSVIAAIMCEGHYSPTQGTSAPI
jgi:DNA-binding transcriptional ArsR family regulator